jgi:putative DNA primase/helicase
VNTIERARGRWREILPRFGVDDKFLKNRHGPCPACGGKDRFRFDDKRGEGTYYCNGCGAGTGVILVRKMQGLSHAEACSAIDEIIGREVRAPAPERLTTPKNQDEVRKSAILRLLHEADSQHVVDAYLMRRGLSVTSPVLKGHRVCPYFVEGGRLQGRYPAVLAPLIGPDGALVSLQRVYDADLEERKKTMAPVGTITGATVRLHDPGDELGVCEGFETGLAARELFGVPVWASLSASSLEAFEPPPVRQLIVFADNDVNGEGQAAAFNLARRVNRWNRQNHKDALPVIVHVPPRSGSDWLDVLRERGAA